MSSFPSVPFLFEVEVEVFISQVDLLINGVTSMCLVYLLPVHSQVFQCQQPICEEVLAVGSSYDVGSNNQMINLLFPIENLSI